VSFESSMMNVKVDTLSVSKYLSLVTSTATATSILKWMECTDVPFCLSWRCLTNLRLCCARQELLRALRILDSL
jgi:hypothetical protein